MNLEVRYAKSFLRDLKNLEYAAREQIYEFAFEEFMQIKQIHDLPGLQRIGADAIFYRFTVGDYMIAIEMTGQIVKFLRVLPKPHI